MLVSLNFEESGLQPTKGGMGYMGWWIVRIAKAMGVGDAIGKELGGNLGLKKTVMHSTWQLRGGVEAG